MIVDVHHSAAGLHRALLGDTDGEADAAAAALAEMIDLPRENAQFPLSHQTAMSS